MKAFVGVKVLRALEKCACTESKLLRYNFSTSGEGALNLSGANGPILGSIFISPANRKEITPGLSLSFPNSLL